MIKQLIPPEVCLKCKGCCRFKEQHSAWSPCLLDEEALELADNKDIPAVFISLDKRITPVQLSGEEGFVCTLLNVADNKCKIYLKRPFECQLYPFLINLRNKKVYLTVDINCPYVQENLKTKEFKEYTEYLQALLNTPAQMKILRDNPQIVQAYSEVLELLELDI